MITWPRSFCFHDKLINWQLKSKVLIHMYSKIGTGDNEHVFKPNSIIRGPSQLGSLISWTKGVSCSGFHMTEEVQLIADQTYRKITQWSDLKLLLSLIPFRHIFSWHLTLVEIFNYAKPRTTDGNWFLHSICYQYIIKYEYSYVSFPLCKCHILKCKYCAPRCTSGAPATYHALLSTLSYKGICVQSATP